MNINDEMKNRLKIALEINEKKPSDLTNDLKIPYSSISMYLSGQRTIKDSKRLYSIAKYLNVTEAWLMGFDVPMERPVEQKEMDELADLVDRLKTDKRFRSLVIGLSKMNLDKIESMMKLFDIND